jgi:hypothetical protein
MIRLWSFQTEEAVQELQQTGYLIGRREFIETDFIPAYDWLRQQMIHKIGPPPVPDQYPMWAWYQHPGSDLEVSQHFPPSPRVRVDLEIDPKDVVLSDFISWHYVLNYWYLSNSETDHNRFEQELHRHNLDYHRTKPLPDPQYHGMIEQSWNKIFDINYVTDTPPERKSIQATFWKLTIDHVREVHRFTD